MYSVLYTQVYDTRKHKVYLLLDLSYLLYMYSKLYIGREKNKSYKDFCGLFFFCDFDIIVAADFLFFFLFISPRAGLYLRVFFFTTKTVA
jgi:hypothetical protein